MTNPPAHRMCSFASRLLLSLLVSVSLLAPAVSAASDRPAEPQLTFDILFGEDTLGRQARDLSWSPDGDRLAYRWEDTGGEALWVLDLGSTPPQPRPVFRPGDAGTSEDYAVDAYHWSPAGDALLFESGGDLHLFDLESRSLRRLTGTPAEEEEPAFSPDGSKLAFIRDFDLHVIDLASGEERALTAGGEENRILNAITDWVYWEEIWGRDSTGFWWSPDGTRIAYYQFDEAPVATYPLVDFSGQYPQVRWQKYPKAGTDNPRVRLGVIDVASRETTWLDTGPDPTEYLARVHWHPDGGGLAVERLNRDQDRLDVLLCGAGDGVCRTLLTETWPTWVNLGDEFTWLPDGRFLWGSERSGWRHLYLYDGEGRQIRRLTDGEVAVTSLDAVGSPAGWVVYTAHAEAPLGAAERRVHRVRLDGSARETLADEGGWNGAEVAPETGLWVHTWSNADTPSKSIVRDASGRELAALPSEPPVFDPEKLPRWETFQIEGPEGVKLPARRLLPPGLDPRRPDPARRHPVIMYHYGCPASQVVADRWGRRGRDLWHKMMAERGYVVLSVDNRGSVFFGKRGEDRAHRRFGPGNLAAQQAGVEYLRSQPWVDPDRIGLWGWSGGGSNTLYCLLESPGTWRAGVAGAPVTDWRLYDTIWTERYLDHPDDNPEGYEASSPVTYADRLEDALFIVHGTGDDNVHPQNTMAMSHTLVEAGKVFEQAVHPGEKHGYRDKASRNFYERMTDFFDRHLKHAEIRPRVDGDGEPEG